jgi:hypothetical protein
LKFNQRSGIVVVVVAIIIVVVAIIIIVVSIIIVVVVVVAIIVVASEPIVDAVAGTTVTPGAALRSFQAEATSCRRTTPTPWMRRSPWSWARTSSRS